VSKATFFHYTSDLATHIGSILRTGIIRTTESNLDINKPHAGPDVVWLLDEPLRPGEDHGLRTRQPGLDPRAKMAVEIAVRLPVAEVQPWRDWATAHGIDPAWFRRMCEVGGGEGQAERWRVIERPIPSREWAHVRYVAAGRLLVPHPLTGAWVEQASEPRSPAR
jgi:hypothetical protein